MLKVIEYTGERYYIRFLGKYRDDYIRFEWDTGYVDMKKYYWDKLSKKKRDIIYKKGM